MEAVLEVMVVAAVKLVVMVEATASPSLPSFLQNKEGCFAD